MCFTYGQWLQMKMTTDGLPESEADETSLPETVSGRSKLGIGVPSDEPFTFDPLTAGKPSTLGPATPEFNPGATGVPGCPIPAVAGFVP